MSDYKPITGELRGAWIGQDVDTWMFDKELFGNLCDRIDAIHAGLERENTALKVELDRMLGEQEEYTHARIENITDELREWANTFSDMWKDHEKALAIADRIDAELTERYVVMPLDADGVPINVGDRMVGPYLEPSYVDGVGVGVFFVYDGEAMYHGYDAKCYRHHHAPTVEDVLREFALKVAGEDCMTMRTGVVEEYASKLRLAGDAS